VVVRNKLRTNLRVADQQDTTANATPLLRFLRPFSELYFLRMARYLISFDDGSMDHIPEADLPAVGEAAHAVVREAKAAGVWIFGGGVRRQQTTIVAADGTILLGPTIETKAVVGGFSIIEVPTLDEALIWAARIAKSCQCAQEVREIMFDRES